MRIRLFLPFPFRAPPAINPGIGRAAKSQRFATPVV
jgi:hypothetical protein